MSLLLPCFVAQVGAAQRSSEKKPSLSFQKVTKRKFEEKSPVSKVTGYMLAIYWNRTPSQTFFTIIFQENCQESYELL